MKLLKGKHLVWLFVCCVLDVASALPREGDRKDDTSKSTKLTKLTRFLERISYSRFTEKFAFPEALDFDFLVDGEEPVRSRSRKVSKLQNIPTFDSKGIQHKRNRQNQQFYIGDQGAYQVTANARSGGSTETELKAIYRNGHGEKCFFARGNSYCWRIDGEGTFETASYDGDTIDESPTDSQKTRMKRQLVYTDFDPTMFYKVAYVVDKAFMDWFRDLSEDDATAVQDAEDYIYMLNTEVNYMYRGIKEVSEASASIPDMDITVYAQGFYYPALGTEWSWLSRYVSGGTIPVSGTFPAFGNWVTTSIVSRSGPFDTAALITPRSITRNGGNILGIAYTDTVCNPFNTNRRVSFNEDKRYDVAVTLAHEIGHSIGADHDGSEGCPAGTYLMSPYAFEITPSTQATWNRWSSCSVGQIVAHVNQYSGCLLDGNISDDDFYDQLCRGVRGSNQFDINYQCKTASKVQTSVVCSPSETASSGKVPAQACRDDSLIRCSNSLGACSDSILTVYDGTPCTGGDPAKDYVCHRGDCLEKVDVCAGRPTTPTNEPTTGSTAGTTTTEQPPACSCSDVFVFVRFICCGSGRNDDGSCCTGCIPNRRNTACRTDWNVAR